MSDDNAEKACWNAEKRLDEQYQESLANYAEAGYESPVTEWETNFWEAGFKRGVSVGVEAGRASRDAEVTELRSNWENDCGHLERAENTVQSLREQLTAERTRADKAETEMHSRELHHFEVEEENESLRGVIERVSAWNTLLNGRPRYRELGDILAAVPVEPQTSHEGGQ